MTDPPPDAAAQSTSQTRSHETELEEIVEAYARRLHAGDAPDPYELMVLHLSLARELEERLKVVELLYAGQGSPAPISAASANPSPAAQKIGRYELLQRLGSGASAVVFRAWDPKLQRYVALKVLREEVMRDADTTARFDREAPIVARLRHPHIVPLHEAGEADGRRYLDSELVVGETLAERLLRQPRLTLRQSADLVEKIASALDYAHGQGIIHRDVKPANILIDEQGQPQLTDFGLAHHDEAAATLTLEGQLIGTPAYMSPEQARGGLTVDRRTDIYSLGVVLYELLTGRLPFAPSSSYPALLYKIVHDDPPPPRSVNPSIPHVVELICLKALAKEPADRFGSAGEFAAELRRWLNDEPSRLRRPGPWEIAQRWARRNKLVSWTVLTASCAVTVAIGIACWQHTLQVAHLRAQAEVQVAALHDAARQRLRQPTQGRRQQSLELLRQIAAHRRLLPQGPSRERLDLQTRTLFAWTQAVPEVLTAQQAEFGGVWDRVWPVAIHPKGDRLAIGTDKGPRLWRRGDPFPLGSTGEQFKPASILTFSPDGKLLLVGPDRDGVQAWDADCVQILGQWKDETGGRVLAFGFVAGCSSVAACTANGGVQQLSLPQLSAVATWAIQKGSDEWTSAAFNHDASKVVRGNWQGQVEIYEASGKQTLAFAADPILIEALAWSPDDRWVAVGSRAGAVRLFDASSGQPGNTFQVGVTGVGSIVFSPDGRLLLAGQRGTTTKVRDLATGRRLVHGPGPPSLSLSSDGRMFAAAGPAYVGLYELSLPEVIQEYSGHNHDVQQVVWSDDSRHFATIDTAIQIHVWELGRAVPVFSVRAPSADLYAHRSNAGLALTADGGLLAYASGGINRSHLFVRDTRTGGVLWEGTIGGGYEHLTAVGQDRFLLAREQADPARNSSHTAVYQWPVGQAPKLDKVLRQGRPEERGYFDGELSRDGKLFLWSGPRTPRQQQRLEVWNIANSTVKRFSRPGRSPNAETNFCLSDDARFVHVNHGGGEPFILNLQTGTQREMKGGPVAIARGGQWLLNWFPSGTQLVRNHREETPLIEFMMPGDDELSLSQGVAFSPDGRFLIWGNAKGPVRVANLAALQSSLAQFESSSSK